ncbi:GntR family transcriptional regulator [Arthrobacter sp. AK01]|uniref:GntR family transcriptional regulator n=1 Tax=Micrococcaceae TaxID=1268 RepID=UPI001E655A04|nr:MULTISPECIES: GntR family transcriptional regulator [Micrococcaceae]MCD4853420.1 GntR family transcriptional regulator [Arthrobacter sp. AK01]MCP1413776.1 DNA-binding GntR family transcriptional regulator [Paenarthrobacter sp. A20]
MKLKEWPEPTISLPQSHQSSADLARVEIQRLIISGEFMPGDRLRERELSQILALSRIPVREALQQLQGEGFVKSSLRRGAIVKRITLSDVNELFDLRLTLEVFAASCAAQSVHNGHPAEHLQCLLAQAEEASVRQDPLGLAHCNTALHAEIVVLCGNSLLERTVSPLLSRLHWLFSLSGKSSLESQCPQHQGLIQAIQRGATDLAGALAITHIELTRERVIQALAERLQAP